jgi:hypothetical protein
MIRYLDIFTQAGIAPGDLSVMRAVFENTNPGDPAFVALCTLQESTFFGADVRVAKSVDAFDAAKRRHHCYSQTPCGTAVTGAGATNLQNGTNKNVHYTIVSAPDYVKCELVSPQLANLEMQVRGPGDTLLAPLFALPPGYAGAPYTAGGDNQTSFYIFTGEKNAFNGGFGTRLFIDVSYREGSGTPTYPIEYGITCHAGNGHSIPWFRASAADDF